MKKNGLFKAILIVFGSLMLVSAILAVLGYFVPAMEGMFTMIPVGDAFLSFVQSFYYFFDTVFYLLVLGAFYGVLNVVPAYKKLLDNIATKVKANGKLFVIITTVIFAILAFVTGQIGVLLIFVPLVASIILLLGYDKLVAISSTVVAMLIGTMSGLFVTFRDPNNYYGYSATTFEGVAGADLYSNLWPKLILLVLGTTLLVFFIIRYIKSVQCKKIKYELNEGNEVIVSEVKGDYKNIKTWPIIVILVFILVFLLLGYMPWNSLFKINCFEKFNEWITGLKIGEFAIFTNVISSISYAIGNWSSLGTYMSIIITLLVFTLIIKFVYRIKFEEVLDGFTDGAKKMLPTVFLVSLTLAILVSAYNHGFVQNIITWFAETKVGINVGTVSLIGAIGTLLHTDLYYTVAGVLLPMMNSVTDESLYAVYAMAFQNVYGIVSIVSPTSLLVIFALKYFDVPYTTWIKYIWRFVLMLLLLALLVLLVVALI